jgi:GRAB domain
MNEHLVEALRRLRRTSTSTNVDRRLVSNVLLQFLSTPRGDTKRFEMLTLLASILSWTDDEREKAGLQQSSGSSTSAMWSKSSSLSPIISKSKTLELEKTDETEVTSLFSTSIMPLISAVCAVVLASLGRIPSHGSSGRRGSRVTNRRENQCFLARHTNTRCLQPALRRFSLDNYQRDAKTGVDGPCNDKLS